MLATDVAMPQMLGVELACKVAEAGADVPRGVSGRRDWPSALVRDLSVALPSVAVLEEPAIVSELVRKVLGNAAPKHRRPSTVDSLRDRYDVFALRQTARAGA